MNYTAKEITLLEKAVAAFHEQTGMDMVLKTMPSNLGGVDATASLDGKSFDLEVKPSITNQNLYAVMNGVSRATDKNAVLLVTRYINPNLMDKLRDASVSCIDTAGNAYIHQPPVYIFVKGNKVDQETSYLKTGRVFQYSGLKVIFALLRNPELIGQTYRDIAEEAGVSLGSVGWILSDLSHEGYVHKSGSKRKLVDKERLLKNWVEHYPKLKRKHLLGTFTTEITGWWKNIDIEQFGGFWGGEIAAEAYTQYLQAKDGVVFVDPLKLGDFIKIARLKKRQSQESDEMGVELVEPFWKQEVGQEKEGLAPPLLVYADLINSNDARNLETAERLYDRYLN